MKRVRVLPTWSKLSEHCSGMRVHQELCLAALDDGAQVIINTAMTGDGKTRAGLLVAGKIGGRVLAIYPTRELMQDQQRALSSSSKAMNIMPEWQWRVLNAETLDELQEEAREVNREVSRAGLVREQLMRRNTHLISSPDLIHMISSGDYAPRDNAGLQDLLLGQVQTLIVDEFHLYDEMQVHKVLLFIAQARAVNPGMVTLLLSATAKPEVSERLQNMGLKTQIIEGQYAHQEKSPGEGQWQMILQGVTLHLPEEAQIGANSSASATDWVQSFAPELERMLRLPGSKGLIVMNSLREAGLAYEALQNRPISLGRITGLTPRQERTRARKDVSEGGDQLIIATSTVDVGVDFELSALAFQAWDSAAFIQRLGRLGRAKIASIDEYHAWTNVGLPFEDGQTVTRPELFEAVRNELPTRGMIGSYFQNWGRVLNTLRTLQHNNTNAHQKAVRTAFKKQLQDGLSGLAMEINKEQKTIKITLPRHYWRENQKTYLNLNDSNHRFIGEILNDFRSNEEMELYLEDLDGHQSRIGILRALRMAEFVVEDQKKNGLLQARMTAWRTQSLALKVHFKGSWQTNWRQTQNEPQLPRVIKGLMISSEERDKTLDTYGGQINQNLEQAKLLVLPLPNVKDPWSAKAKFGLGPLSDIREIYDANNERRICACGPLALAIDAPRIHQYVTQEDLKT